MEFGAVGTLMPAPRRLDSAWYAHVPTIDSAVL